MKKALSILLSSVLLMTVIIAVPFTASAATDRVIDLSISPLLAQKDVTMKYEGGILKFNVTDWYWNSIPIKNVGSKSEEWCKQMGLKYTNGDWVQLESSKKYAVTLNYKFVNNGDNKNEIRNLPQIAIGYDKNGSPTAAKAFYAAAVKNHVLTEEGNSYYLSAVIEGNGKPLRIAFSGVWNFEINSILLQEIDADEKNQVTVVYCDGGEYKAEFAEKDGPLKTPVKDGKKFVGWYSKSESGDEKVTTASAGTVLYAKWINPIEGDLNEDEKVDIRDLVVLKEASINQDTDMKYDLNGDSMPANEGDFSFLKKLLLNITG